MKLPVPVSGEPGFGRVPGRSLLQSHLSGSNLVGIRACSRRRVQLVWTCTAFFNLEAGMNEVDIPIWNLAQRFLIGDGRCASRQLFFFPFRPTTRLDYVLWRALKVELVVSLYV